MKNAFEVAINNGEIRKTENGWVSVIDLISSIREVEKKAAHGIWTRMQNDHSEVSAFCRYFKFPGRGQADTPIMNFECAVRTIMLLKGVKAAKIRQDATRTLARYLQADITLADEIIQRNDNPDDLKWIDARTKGKLKRRGLTDTMNAHGAIGYTYSKVSDMTNQVVTGKTAKDIKNERGVTTTRDGLTSDELLHVAVAENLEESNIKIKKAQGHEEIVGAAQEVVKDLAPIFKKYRVE